MLKLIRILNLNYIDSVIFYPMVKSRDIPTCNLLAKCREIISLVDFLLFVFYIAGKPRKSVTSYLLMNINELMLLP